MFSKHILQSPIDYQDRSISMFFGSKALSSAISKFTFYSHLKIIPLHHHHLLKVSSSDSLYLVAFA